MYPMKAIERAIQVFGSQAAMASALGIKQPTISEWLRGERRVPAERCPEIERETRRRGQPVLCEELRPDVAWDVLREQVDEGAAAQLPAKPKKARSPANDHREIHGVGSEARHTAFGDIRIDRRERPE